MKQHNLDSLQRREGGGEIIFVQKMHDSVPCSA